MKSTILMVVVMFLMLVTCEILDQREDETRGNHLSDQQIYKFENSLFNIFDRLGSNLKRNKTGTDDGSSNNLNIIKSLSLYVSLSPDSNCNNSDKKDEANNADLTTNIASNISVLLERITKLETSLEQNLKSMDEKISVLTSNASSLVNNTDTKKLPELINPCQTATASGVFNFEQMNQHVYCEMTTFGGGWIVFQQRIHSEDKRNYREYLINFNRNWTDYRDGFGTVGKDTEFWLGLEILHQMTNGGGYEFAADMVKSGGDYGYARYSEFRVSGENDQYRLTVSGYSGTAGDSFSELNNMEFTTFDRDNDNDIRGNCASSHVSGWWYDQCRTPKYCLPNYVNMNWPNFVSYTSGLYIRMMVRRK